MTNCFAKKEVYSPPEKVVDKVSKFKIINYLLKPVKVVAKGEDGIEVAIVEKLDPKSSKTLSQISYDSFIRNGNTISIYIIPDHFGSQTKADNSSDEQILFSNYTLDFSSRSISCLRIGMITSKWVGADQDSVYVPAAYAVQGRPWVKIHNLTNIPITFAPLNGNLKISPYSTSRYSGRDHFGVRIGTLFTDSSELYPVFKFKIPATDIYYGVVSDIEQPEFGGWQIDAKFSDIPDEPQWLLENGWEGGPGYGRIVPGYLPKSGPNENYFQNLNEWGQLLPSL